MRKAEKLYSVILKNTILQFDKLKKEHSIKMEGSEVQDFIPVTMNDEFRQMDVSRMIKETSISALSVPLTLKFLI